MIKTKKQMFTVVGVFALIMMLGTITYAFFNYTRTGSANVIKTGRITFNSTQGTAMNLNNLFPIDPEETGIMNDATKVGTVTINVTGDTTYGDGIEYKVSAVNVQNTVGSGANAKSLPISIAVSVTSNTENDPATTLGTSDDSYYTNRGPSASTSIYKVLASDVIENNQELLVGYIKQGATGIDGNIVIKAYVDKNKVAITDTYPEGDVTHSEGEEPNQTTIIDYTNGTTSTWVGDRTVFTAEEWNGLQTNGVSFQVKVEANEGIWITGPTTTATFDTGRVVNRKLLKIFLTDYPNAQASVQDDVFDGIIMSNRDIIELVDEMPNIENFSDYNILSSVDSENVIYGWFDTCDGHNYCRIKIYSSADILYLNEDSSYMFYGCESFTGDEILDKLDASKVLNMNNMFATSSKVNFSKLRNWDVSNVMDMSKMFYGSLNDYNTDASAINNWDVSSVQNFTNMFFVDSLENQSMLTYPTFTLRPGTWDNSLDQYGNYSGTYVPNNSNSYIGTAAEYISGLTGLEEISGAKRFVGSNPNNYVQFNGELWRIVGVYNDSVNGDKLKIVKATPSTNSIQYKDSPSYIDNAWNESLVNTYLNGSYYNSLSSSAKEMIYESNSWDMGAVRYNDNATQAYENASAHHWTGKISVISSYEYLYAAGQNCRNISGSFDGQFITSCLSNDWLHPILTNNGTYDSWLGPSAGDNHYAIFVDCFNGGINDTEVSLYKAVSPVLYLKSNVTIINGQGTSGSPYVLNYTTS